MTKRANSEELIQAAVVLHLAVRSLPGTVFWHTGNGGYRTAAEAGRFKALGVKSGVPDLLVLRAGQLYGLELKAHGGRLSPTQVDMLAELEAAGAVTAVAFGLDEALGVLERWGIIRPSRASGSCGETVALAAGGGRGAC